MEIPAWFQALQNVMQKGQAGGDNDNAPLHLGTSIFRPPEHLLVENMGEASPPAVQDYTAPKGHPLLVETLVNLVNERNTKMNIDASNLLVTSGATHGLMVTAKVLAGDGGEILVLSPHWLFIMGVFEMAGAKPVSVPFFDRLKGNPEEDFETHVSPSVNENTRAIYLNYPNNPTGVPMNAAYLKALIAFAQKHDLKIIGDYAYMDYDFSEHGFLDLNNFEGARERLVSVFTLSKCYGIAGYRVGYLVSFMKGFVEQATWAAMHSVYSTNTPAQIAGAKLIKELGLVSPFRDQCKKGIEIFNEFLPEAPLHPQGGYYAFIPTQLHGEPCSYEAFLEAGLKEGVTVSPGKAFGEAYDHWARVSLVAVDPSLLEKGVKRLQKLMF